MNTLKNNTYSWNDSIEITLSNGGLFELKLSDNRDAEYMGYTCESCGSPTTLAFWNCGSCANPFEPKDIKEAKSLFPDIKVAIEDPNRLVYMLTHRSWLCLQCESFNTNLPWENAYNSEVDCINCGKNYEAWKDILFEDTVSSNPKSSALDFKNKILDIISDHRMSEKKQRELPLQQKTYWNRNISHTKTSYSSHYRQEVIASPEWRNKIKLLAGILGTSSLLYILYYGLVQKVDYDIKVSWHNWSNLRYVDRYWPQSDDGWEARINPSDYDNFKITRTVSKEAPWDSYEVVIGQERVEDTSVCERYDNPREQCNNPSETCSYATVNGVTVKGNCYTPAPSCYTPSKTCEQYGTKLEDVKETRYNKHPYIDFNYTDWGVVESLPNSWIGKNPEWKKSKKYSDIDTNSLLRYREISSKSKRTIKIIIQSWWDQTIQLPHNQWMRLDSWDSCTSQWTRWRWVSTADILDVIDECERVK